MTRLLSIALLAATLSAQTCPEELSGVVLKVLFKRPALEYGGLNDMSGQDITKDRIKAEQDEIDCLRKWADKNTRDCTHAAYLEWLGHFQRQLDDAKREYATKKQESDQTAYERDLDAKWKKIEKYQKLHSVPVPPVICTDNTKAKK